MSNELFGQGMCDVKTFQLASLKGKVVSDGPNGTEPIEKAKIEIRKLNKKRTLVRPLFTNQDGTFEINDISKGKYVVTVSKREFKFLDYFFGLDKTGNRNLESDSSILVQLGVSLLEPCGGGTVRLERNKSISFLDRGQSCNIANLEANHSALSESNY